MMLHSRRLLWCALVGLMAAHSPGASDATSHAQPPTGPSTPAAAAPLTPELKAAILAAMRLNRQAFQEDRILERYGESRPSVTHPAFAACDLPRTPAGAPAAHYPAPQARSTPRPYTEAKVVDCLQTTGGLAGTRAIPLAQHYYCSLPGLSPDIRGCFTFQLRLPRVSRTRSAWDQGYMPDGTRLPLQRGWNFLGPDPAKVPDAAKAFAYCATDGRPHWIKDRRGRNVEVSQVHPTPTRPMCWIAQTQADLFQGIMGGAIAPPMAEQVELLREYYECETIKSKVSRARFKVLCEYETGGA